MLLNKLTFVEGQSENEKKNKRNNKKWSKTQKMKESLS